MTLSELRTLVLSYLDDPDAGYFTNTQTLAWINDAQKEVQKLIGQAFEGYFIKCVETVTVLNQREYQLPTDCKRVHRLELILSGTSITSYDMRRMRKISRNQQDFAPKNTGTPQYYFFQGNYIVLVPCPDNVWTMRLYYEYVLPDLVNDSDSPDLPDQYHEMVALYAARDGFIKDGRDAALLQRKIDDFEKMLKQDAEQRNADEPRTIVQTIDDDFDGYW